MTSQDNSHRKVHALPKIGWGFFAIGVLSMIATIDLNWGFMVYGPVFGVALLVGLFSTLRCVSASAVVLMFAAAVTPGGAYLGVAEYKVAAASKLEENERERRLRFDASIKAQMLMGKVAAYRDDIGSLPPDLQALLTEPSGARGWLGPYAKPRDLLDPLGSPFLYEVVAERPKVRSQNYEVDPLD